MPGLICDECGLPVVPFGGEDICMGHGDERYASFVEAMQRNADAVQRSVHDDEPEEPIEDIEELT